MKVILDSEWNGLESPDKCWIIVCREVEEPDNVWCFTRPDKNPEAFVNFARKVSCWIGHNIIDYDLPLLSTFIAGFRFDPSCVIDTLVVSRLVNYKLEGGHSVENYAVRLGLPQSKIQISDWSAYTPEIKDRCITDTTIQLSIYRYLEKYIHLNSFKSALRLEHNNAFACRELKENGFPFNKEQAEELFTELNLRLSSLDEELKTAFPPKKVLKDTINPRVTKSGAIFSADYRRLLSAGYNGNEITPEKSYEIWVKEEFNPGSLKQIIERLWDAGWKPTEKTKGHLEAAKSYLEGKRVRKADVSANAERFQRYGWKLSEVNLSSLPDTAPEGAKKLVERLLLASRVSDLEEWINLCKSSVEPGKPILWKIHGSFNTIGAWTHRMSTSKPNMQNIPVPQHKDNPSELDVLSDDINARMRSLWVASPGKVLVGTDAVGIQMCIFAHYVNDPRLIKALIDGRKEDKTDIHSLHWTALGPACKGRNPAKTFIYAWLLGAGKAKVAEILECGFEEAGRAIEQFIEFYPGLKDLKSNRILEDGRRGYFEGLDKRLVICYDAHRILAGYLQNGEAVIMKQARDIWQPRLISERVPFVFRNFVHDEWQTETEPEYADYIGEVQADSIRLAGESLRLNCPLKGDFRVGQSWQETH